MVTNHLLTGMILQVVGVHISPLGPRIDPSRPSRSTPRSTPQRLSQRASSNLGPRWAPKIQLINGVSYNFYHGKYPQNLPFLEVFYGK